MPEDIIKVENLSKIYRLGETSTGSLAHDLNRWWSKINGQEDPYEKLAETNERSMKSNTGYVWSLKDISFSVKEGEVYGIIGKNGAGKSTLLKILSKITKPTKGTIKIAGRIASLLEVGTGFHPDLSGRENVFLNGAILGMRKQEIKDKFDEIISFSGIERYIDTPVKRYSSGMLVRLAFAVAAHLEPEILIIDEVLAVGDAEFQKKCLGKMEQVSQHEGRTVLFVSHNLSAVKRLCNRAMLLEKGQIKIINSVEKVLENYQESENDIENGVRNKLPENETGYFLEWSAEGQLPENAHSCYTREDFFLTFRFQCLRELRECEFHLLIRNNDGTILLHSNSINFSGKHFTLFNGLYDFRVNLILPVANGKYNVEAGLVSSGKLIDHWTTSTPLLVLDTFENHSSDSTYNGILNIKTNFSFNRKQEHILL